MSAIFPFFSILLPELFQLIIVIALFAQIILKPKNLTSKWLPWAASVNIIISIIALPMQGELFNDVYLIDGLSQFFKLAVSVGFWFVIINGQKQATLERDKKLDYFLLLTISAWGLMLLSSSVEIITLIIALEISSYSLYALVPMRVDSKQAAEAGAKYILFGAAATALSLYGFSYILAEHHTSYLNELVLKDWSFQSSPGAVVGLILFLFSFFYKLALFPFHFWAPDVYQGTSNETASYVATLPKLGAIVILIRFAVFLKPELEVTTLIAVLGAISMTYGNLSALVQKDMKRLLGYSGIAHAGYITLGLVAGNAMGLASCAFYIFVYVIMNLACFWVICHLSKDGKNVSIEDISGLYKRSPVLAFVLAVALFSLVGLPPTAGFMGKLFLFMSVWNKGYNWLVVLAAVNTAISIYYYLNIVRHAYTREDETVMRMKVGGLLWGGLLAGIVLLLGIFPNLLYLWTVRAGQQLLP